MCVGASGVGTRFIKVLRWGEGRIRKGAAASIVKKTIMTPVKPALFSFFCIDLVYHPIPLVEELHDRFYKLIA